MLMKFGSTQYHTCAKGLKVKFYLAAVPKLEE